MHDVALPPLPANSEYSYVARPGNALTAPQRWLSFGILAAASLAVGITLSAWGAWPVLPYTAVEIAVLAIAFWWLDRRARDWERLVVVNDRVIIERSSGGRREDRELSRHWVQVELEGQGAWPARKRLALRAGGQRVEFGSALPPWERARLARELRQALAARQHRPAARGERDDRITTTGDEVGRNRI